MTKAGAPTPAEPRFGRSSNCSNQLLAHLPSGVRSSLIPHLDQIRFKTGEVVFHAHEPLPAVWFPETAVISLSTHLNNGDALDVGVVGKDGMIGLALLPGVNALPCHATVQIGGTALRISAEALKCELRDAGSAHDLMARFAYSLFAQGVQTAACNTFHSIGHRCARWLLMTHDVVEEDEFPMTQDLLAAMLGVRRPSVTLAAGALQRAGIIDYRYGLVRIRDRQRLETSACECYRLIREAQQRLLGF
jgi:CRP-like cAMP-binding protein